MAIKPTSLITKPSEALISDPTRGKVAPNAPLSGRQRVHVAFTWPPSLIEELRDAVMHMMRTSEYDELPTMSSIAEVAVRDGLAALAKRHNGGKPWPKRTVSKLRKGRPKSE